LEREGALWLLYGQNDDFAVISLLDAKGRGVGGSAFSNTGKEASTAGHPRASEVELVEFAKRIPWSGGPPERMSVGEAFVPKADGAAWIPLLWGIDDPSGGPRQALAAALSVRGLCAELPRSEPAAVHLLDSHGRRLCLSAEIGKLEDLGSVLNQAERGRDSLWRYHDTLGSAFVAAKSDVDFGLSVWVSESEAVAFGASQRVRRQTGFFVAGALALALFVGLLLGRTIVRPIGVLTDAAHKFGGGAYGTRIGWQGRDEFAQLARAFDKMGAEIETQSDEIRAFNAELRQRVEERTEALEQTHAQLLESQRVATMSQLGAGIAHEINNPLTSVLGVLQLVRARLERLGAGEKERKLINSAEEEGLRIRKIVKQVLELTQSNSSARLSHIQPNDLVESTLRLAEAGTEGAEVSVKTDLGHGLPVVLGNFSQLQQALVQVLRNAVQASEPGGVVYVHTRSQDNDTVEICIEDEGLGVPEAVKDKIFEPFFTTAPDKRQGLGLCLAQRILVDHGGRIEVSNRPSAGVSAVLTLPMRRRAHMI
jgi:signal transduction histidine kinase